MLKALLVNPWAKLGALLLILIVLGLLGYLMSSVLIPLFFAFTVAYMFDPLIDWMEGKRIARIYGVLLLMVFLVIGFVLVPIITLPGMVQEAKTLIELPDDAQEFSSLNKGLAMLPLGSVVAYLDWGDKEAWEADPSGLLRERIGSYVEENAADLARNNQETIGELGTRAGKTVAGFVQSVGAFFTGSLAFFGNFLLFAFVTIYLLKDYDDIIATMDDLVPHRFRAKVREIMHRIDEQLKAFLRGQVMVCACLGIMYGIGLYVAGVPFAITLAIFGAFASFIPYLGLVLTIGPAILLTLLAHGLNWHVGAVVGTFVVAQFLEGNILTPRIVGSQVGLGPVWVILAIMVFGSALGFVGLLLAVPTAAVMKVLVVEAVTLYKQSAYFSVGSEAAKVPSDS